MLELRKISFAKILADNRCSVIYKNLLRLVKSVQNGKLFHRLTTLFLKKNSVWF